MSWPALVRVQVPCTEQAASQAARRRQAAMAAARLLLAALALRLPARASAECECGLNVEPNVDYLGNDVKRTTVPTAEACCEFCRYQPGAVVWTYSTGTDFPQVCLSPAKPPPPPPTSFCPLFANLELSNSSSSHARTIARPCLLTTTRAGLLVQVSAGPQPGVRRPGLPSDLRALRQALSASRMVLRHGPALWHSALPWDRLCLQLQGSRSVPPPRAPPSPGHMRNHSRVARPCSSIQQIGHFNSFD